MDLWAILKDDEYKSVWNKVYSEFDFVAGMKSDAPPFKFKVPVDCYDISASKIYSDDEETNKTIKSIFAECMENDDFMYALDWQHTCFRYNPKSNAAIEYSAFVKDYSYAGGGYSVYFPKFYPDGDYFFFIAKDFRFGYLTHPWQKKVWIFGDKLMLSFKENTGKIGFKAVEILQYA